MRPHSKTSTRLLCAFIALVLLATACSPQNAIIGKWESAGAGIVNTLEFFQDGTVRSTTGTLIVTGTYKFVDDDTIRVDLSGLLGLIGSQLFDVSISGNTLTLESGGTSITYNRVKR